MRIIGFILSIAAVVTLSFKLCSSACARAEYEINGECCPMCAPGTHVYWHCSDDTSTTCIPCLALTYTDEPNNLDKCFLCSGCVPSSGLRVKRTCTRSSDTVCEPLEGFYCIQKNKDSCRFALKHTKCLPGQYIKQAGTAFNNTECSNCSEGSYSNGSFTTCQPHSKCEKEGDTVIKPGTLSSDTVCGNSPPYATIVGATVAVLLIVIGTGAGIWIYFRLKHITPFRLPVQDSAHEESKSTPHGSLTPLMV